MIDLTFGDRAAMRAIASLGEFLPIYNAAARELGPGRGLGFAFERKLVGSLDALWKELKLQR